MIKKLLIIFVLILLGIGAVSLYFAHKQERQDAMQIKSTAKAPSVTITLLEGWNNQQMADYLQSKSITTSADFLAKQKAFDSSTYPLLASKPKTADLEGFLFPDTYFIPAEVPSSTNISDVIIQKQLDNFAQKFTPQMQAEASADNMSVFQIITLASIIEKETGHSSADRKIVSGIFYNRLKIGMPLQSDATVAYFTQKNTVSKADLAIINPYNTYLNSGLPPGPICNPSLDSIMAALYPTPSNYLYFLTSLTTGQVYYAVTYDQQQQNIAKYLK